MIEFKRLDHVLISVPPGAIGQVSDFYGQVLGLAELPRQHPNGARWFSLGSIELHIREEEGHVSNSSKHVAFEVGDLGRASSYLKSQEVEIQYSSKIQGRDRCFFCDPWGNRFELITFDDK